MLTSLGNMHPIVQALLATCFTWGVTSLGAAAVFLARQPSRRTLDGMLGFAAGVMIAASYWSLLAPAIEMSEGQGAVLDASGHRVFTWWVFSAWSGYAFTTFASGIAAQ